MRELLLKNAIPIEIPAVKDSMKRAIVAGSQVDLCSGSLAEDFLNLFMKRLGAFSFKETFFAQFKDVQPCNGAIHAFEAFYLRNCDRRLRFFSGDFIYHQIIGRLTSVITPAAISAEDPLRPGDSLIISVPFSGDGNIQTDLEEILETCAENKIPVLLDMAYIPLVKDIPALGAIDTVEDVVFSLSKFSRGLERIRLGIRLRKNFVDDQIGAASSIGMTNNLGFFVGAEVLRDFPLNFPYIEYVEKQSLLCKELSLDQSDCVIFGVGDDDKYSEFNRFGINRVCLSGLMEGHNE